MSLIIKKRVSLEFLGEDYKEAYLIFRSIPLKDYKQIISDLPKNEGDNIKAVELILSYLKKYFYEGKFPNEENKLENITIDDLDELDQTTAIACFETLTGQRLDPKSETPLMNISSMEQENQSKS